MPELPEVQTVVDDLIAAGLTNGTITDARVSWPAIIFGMSPHVFCRKIVGKSIDQIYRRGKYVVLQLGDNHSLIVHLRMTGRFVLTEPLASCCRHIHVVLTMNHDKQLRFHDTRKFGRFYLTDEPERVLGKLGPEPLDHTFTAGMLASGLKARSRQIKPLLLDQCFIAGLGNIYVDEALWKAKIHPLRLASGISIEEARLLHRAIRAVLRTGLQNAGTSLGQGDNNFASLSRGRGGNAEHLKVFRRTGQSCPRCQQSIIRLIVAQRSTHICSNCQRLSGLT